MSTDNPEPLTAEENRDRGEPIDAAAFERWRGERGMSEPRDWRGFLIAHARDLHGCEHDFGGDVRAARPSDDLTRLRDAGALLDMARRHSVVDNDGDGNVRVEFGTWTAMLDFIDAAGRAAHRDPNMDYERRDEMLDVVAKTYAHPSDDLTGLDVERVHLITCGSAVEHQPGSDQPYLWLCTKFIRDYARLERGE